MSAVPKKSSRRRFVLGGLGLTGALIVGWGLSPARQRLTGASPLPVRNGAVALNGWVAVAPDGIVSVAMPRAEMGQGVHTALPMLVAEEMDVPLSMVVLVQAPNDKIYGNLVVLQDSLPFHPDDDSRLKHGAEWIVGKVARELGLNMTGGSSSIKDAWGPMREAGAVARAMLVAAAARQWQVPASACRTEAGFVLHGADQRASYGSLAAQALVAGQGIGPADVRLKDPKQFTLIGRDVPRRDSAGKVNGTTVFGIDARQPGMLYAALRMTPVVGGSVASFDAAAIKALPGVVKVVDVSAALKGMTGAGAGLAVVADTFWRAKQAAAALPVTWSDGPHAALSSAGIFQDFAHQLDTESGHTYYEIGDLDQGKGAVKRLDAEYRAPFLAHATMEPLNCTAQVRDGKVSLWMSTQAPGAAIETAARVAGVGKDQVTIETLMLGGGFGRRLEMDMIEQAVAIALHCDGKPVQLIWTREDDIRHDVYRPAALARFHATLDAGGQVLSYDNKSVSAAIGHQFMSRNLGIPAAGPDKTTAEGEFDMQYAFPNQRIAHVIVESAVPVGYWRSVGHSHNAFFKESFVDELANAAGKDPVAFRRALLQGHPRHLAVLDAAVAAAGTAPEGRKHGVALHQSFNTIVAQVAEVSVVDKTIRVHRVVCAIDCGIVVNPNIVRQQMESGIVFGLSAALGGEITLKDGRVEQGNFGDYPVVRMGEAPEVETVIIKSAGYPQGAGEPAVPPIAPAVANAVFALTGQRLRSLPLKLST